MNPKRRAFVNAYLGSAQANGAKAAISAGYSEKAAAQVASRLLRQADVQAALAQRLDHADLTTAARLRRLGKIADHEPESFTGGDVIRANELILKVNGALKEKPQSSGITVQIGFLSTAAPAAIDVNVVRDYSADSPSHAATVSGLLVSAPGAVCPPESEST